VHIPERCLLIATCRAWRTWLRSWELILLLGWVHLLAHLAHWMLLLSTWPAVIAWLFCALLRLRAVAKVVVECHLHDDDEFESEDKVLLMS
jgi:hypothetical protein